MEGRPSQPAWRHSPRFGLCGGRFQRSRIFFFSRRNGQRFLLGALYVGVYLILNPRHQSLRPTRSTGAPAPTQAKIRRRGRSCLCGRFPHSCATVGKGLDNIHSRRRERWRERGRQASALGEDCHLVRSGRGGFRNFRFRWPFPNTGVNQLFNR